jgi:hypothetical protein
MRKYQRNVGDGHPTDRLLLERIRAGIENFPPFRVSSTDWRDVGT